MMLIEVKHNKIDCCRWYLCHQSEGLIRISGLWFWKSVVAAEAKTELRLPINDGQSEVVSS